MYIHANHGTGVTLPDLLDDFTTAKLADGEVVINN
jgi:hypothetical protein